MVLLCRSTLYHTMIQQDTLVHWLRFTENWEDQQNNHSKLNQSVCLKNSDLHVVRISNYSNFLQQWSDSKAKKHARPVLTTTVSCRKGYIVQLGEALELRERVSFKTRMHGSGMIKWMMTLILEWIARDGFYVSERWRSNCWLIPCNLLSPVKGFIPFSDNSVSAMFDVLSTCM